jgi:hypothetical protein
MNDGMILTRLERPSLRRRASLAAGVVGGTLCAALALEEAAASGA